jgi:membrane protein
VGHKVLQEQERHSALSQFPVIEDQLGQPRRLGGGVGGLVIGALYGGLGMAQATQNTMITAWAVDPLLQRPDRAHQPR